MKSLNLFSGLSDGGFIRFVSLVVIISVRAFSQESPINTQFLPPTANTFTYPQSVFIDVQGKNIWLTDFDNNRVLRFDVSTLSGIKAGREEELRQNRAMISVYPNPFSVSSTISFLSGTGGRVSLEIYSQLGRKITSLFDGNINANTTYNIRYNPVNLASGVYLCILKTPNGIKAEKICLMK